MDDMPSFIDRPFGCPLDEAPRCDTGRKMSVWEWPGLLEDYKDFYARGFSHAQIAGRLNQKYPGANITRNASIGKAHRIGLGIASGRTPAPWDSMPGMLDDFKALHATGITFTAIAEQINAKYPGVDLTQKALRAKATRLGLARRVNRTDGARTRKKRATGWKFPTYNDRQAPQDAAGRLEYRRKVNAGEITPRLTKSPIPKEDDHTPLEMRKPLLDLEAGECRFPYGDGPFTFCARPIGTSHQAYCEYHSLVHVYGMKGAMQFVCHAAE